MLRKVVAGTVILAVGVSASVAAALIPPPIVEIKGVRPEPNAFKDAGRKKPIVIKTAKDAAKYFGAKELTKLQQKVDFENQFVLLFAWRGSGQDRLEYAVAESFPEQIFFSLRPGRTRDLRPHVRVFALRSNVRWRVR